MCRVTGRGVVRAAKPVSLGLTVLLLPLMGLRVQLVNVDAYFHFLHVFDLPLLALCALALIDLRRKRGIGREGLAFAAFGALYALALAAHPTLIGAEVFARLLAAGALAYVVATIDDMTTRLTLLVALAVATAGQVALGALQVANGAPLGIWMLGEFQDPLVGYGDARSPRGTMTDAFALAALGLVAAAAAVRHALGRGRPLRWLALAGVLVVPAGLSYARTALLAVGLSVLSLLPGALRRSTERWAVAALLIGTALPALLTAEGWTGSLSRGLASERVGLAAQAAAIISTAPILGVGPGRYLETLAARPDLHTTRRLERVHGVPLLVAAEAGLPAAAGFAVLLALVLVRAARAGAASLALAGAFAPWILLDAFPYMNPQGTVLAGLWAGLLLQRPTDDLARPFRAAK